MVWVVRIESGVPRDIDWEVDQPAYRDYFWHQPPASPGIFQSHLVHRSAESRLHDAADIHEVLDWAVETARSEQTFTLYVEHGRDNSPGLIRLAGDDPTVVD